MPSFFDTSMTNSAPLMQGAFGAVITSYVSADSATVASVNISLGHVEERETVNEDRPGKVKVRQRAFNLLRDANHANWPGLATVDLQGHFVIDGEKWAVAEITAKTESGISGVLAAYGYIAVAPRGVYRRA